MARFGIGKSGYRCHKGVRFIEATSDPILGGTDFLSISLRGPEDEKGHRELLRIAMSFEEAADFAERIQGYLREVARFEPAATPPPARGDSTGEGE
jgi:hypothetical protein